MTPLVVVATLLAGAVGALARYGVTRLVATPPAGRPSRVPWAVLVVNALGSAIGGALLGLSQADVVSPDWRLVLLTGFCGGLTTFSTFGVETIQLVSEGRMRAAAASVAANLVLGIGLAALAWAVVGALLA